MNPVYAFKHIKTSADDQLMSVGCSSGVSRFGQQVEFTDFLQTVTMLHNLEKRWADLTAGKRDKQVTPVSAKRA